MSEILPGRPYWDRLGDGPCAWPWPARPGHFPLRGKCRAAPAGRAPGFPEGSAGAGRPGFRHEGRRGARAGFLHRRKGEVPIGGESEI